MDLSNRTAMELHFADNFETHLFPVLADHYLKDGDLERARKVCAIGLEYHPKNADGLFILGQANRSDGDLQKAEQSFKSVLTNGTVHLQAATGLAEIQTELQRSEATVMKTWQQVLKWDPSNKTARELVNSFEMKKPQRKVKKIKRDAPNKGNNSIEINLRLATFTMCFAQSGPESSSVNRSGYAGEKWGRYKTYSKRKTRYYKKNGRLE